MALGLPCVSTSLGAEGMYLVDGVNVLLADDPKTFVNQIKKSYHDQRLWQKLRKGGLKNIEDHFSSDAAKAVLQTMLK